MPVVRDDLPIAGVVQGVEISGCAHLPRASLVRDFRDSVVMDEPQFEEARTAQCNRKAVANKDRVRLLLSGVVRHTSPSVYNYGRT
jgi:hypothetical protein